MVLRLIFEKRSNTIVRWTSDLAEKRIGQARDVANLWSSVLVIKEEWGKTCNSAIFGGGWPVVSSQQSRASKRGRFFRRPLFAQINKADRPSCPSASPFWESPAA